MTPIHGGVMMRPLVAVVGSVEAVRSYDPPLQAAEAARQACVELGEALARAGCDIAVFSSSPAFVEADVVRGYAAGGGRRVVVAQTLHRNHVFAGDESVRFEVLVDPGDQWEVAYYRGILSADGLIVIGGGRSARIAGILAVSQRIPLVALAMFGAGAESVWRQFQLSGGGDATPAEVNSMARKWSDASARDLIACLVAQKDRRAARNVEVHRSREADRRRRTRLAFAAVILLLLAAAALPIASASTSRTVGLALLGFGPLLPAASGAMLRDAAGRVPTGIWAVARGLGAGFVTSLLYCASQLLGSPDLLDKLDTLRLLFFVLPLGFVAGLTVDLVYARLQHVQTVNTSAIDVTGTSDLAP